MTAERLKTSILQLAIRGKLVKQDPKDEAVYKLLEKIKEERKKLILENKIKKEKYSEIYKDCFDNHYYEKFEDGIIKDITEEIPFEIPDSWQWCRLIDICIIIFSGKSPKYSKIPNDNFVLGQKNNQDYGIDLNGIKYCINEFIEKYPKELYLKNNDVLLNTLGGGTVGRSGIFELSDNKRYITDGHLFVIRTLFEETAKYILYYLKSIKNQIEKSADGSTNQVFLKLDSVKKYLIPIPPLKEQVRITKKICLLDKFILNYNNYYLKLEKLDSSYKEELKKSILQYVVQGKLVKQDLEDEMAEDLINKILDEKRELIKNKKIKKENLSVIYKKCEDNQFYEKFDDGTINNITEEIPFEIPNNWVWTRLGTILKKLTDGTHKTPKYTNTGIPFLSVKDMSLGIINFDNTKFISEEEHKLLYERCNPEKGDIILSKIGTTGIPVIINTDRQFSLFVSVALLKFNSNLINREFLKYILLSPLVQKQCKENTKGVGNKNWVIKDIANTLIVLPGLNEQCRIAKKIKILFNNL